MLEYIADHPAAMSATVDLEHGLVYRTTTKGFRVWRPLVGLAWSGDRMHDNDLNRSLRLQASCTKSRHPNRLDR